jgi:hypothetical protein
MRTLHLILPRRIPSRRRLVNTIRTHDFHTHIRFTPAARRASAR